MITGKEMTYLNGKFSSDEPAVLLYNIREHVSYINGRKEPEDRFHKIEDSYEKICDLMRRRNNEDFSLMQNDN